MDNSAINRWLDDLAIYFERRDTHGEDRAHWANVYDAEAARKIKAALSAAEARIERLEAALEPFKRAADAIDALDPSFPDHAAACRASFDYYQRHVGRDNSEEVTRHSVTAGDFRRARAALEGETK